MFDKNEFKSDKNELLDLSISAKCNQSSQQNSDTNFKNRIDGVVNGLLTNNGYKFKLDLKGLGVKTNYSSLNKDGNSVGTNIYCQFGRTAYSDISDAESAEDEIDTVSVEKVKISNKLQQNTQQALESVNPLRNLRRVSNPLIGDMTSIKHKLPLIAQPERDKKFKTNTALGNNVIKSTGTENRKKETSTIEIQTEKVFSITEEEYEIVQFIKSNGITMDALTSLTENSIEDINNNTDNLSASHQPLETIVIDEDASDDMVKDEIIRNLIIHSNANKAILSKFYETFQKITLSKPLSDVESNNTQELNNKGHQMAMLAQTLKASSQLLAKMSTEFVDSPEAPVPLSNNNNKIPTAQATEITKKKEIFAPQVQNKGNDMLPRAQSDSSLLNETAIPGESFIQYLERRQSEQQQYQLYFQQQAQQTLAQHAQAQHAQAQHAQAQHAHAQHAQAQNAQTQHAQVKHAQVQHSQVQHAQVQHAQAQHAQVQHAQAQHVQVQHTQVQHTQAQHAQQAEHAQKAHQAQQSQAQARHAQLAQQSHNVRQPQAAVRQPNLVPQAAIKSLKQYQPPLPEMRPADNSRPGGGSQDNSRPGGGSQDNSMVNMMQMPQLRNAAHTQQQPSAMHTSLPSVVPDYYSPYQEYQRFYNRSVDNTDARHARRWHPFRQNINEQYERPDRLQAQMAEQQRREAQLQQAAWQSQLTNYPNSAWSRSVREAHSI